MKLGAIDANGTLTRFGQMLLLLQTLRPSPEVLIDDPAFLDYDNWSVCCSTCASGL
jgi:hypothetical protein